MKYLRLLVVFVVLVAGVYFLWQFSGPVATEAPTNTAQSSPLASVQKPAEAASASQKPAMVAAGVEPPVVTAAIKAEAAQPIAPRAAEPDPQADLNDCIAQTLKMIEAKDVAGLVKTLMPPDEIQKMIASGRVASVEDIVTQFSQMPNLNERFQQLQRTLEAVKDLKPEMNADSTKATYPIDPAVDGYNSPGDRKNVLTFTKVGGFWYMD